MYTSTSTQNGPIHTCTCVYWNCSLSTLGSGVEKYSELDAYYLIIRLDKQTVSVSQPDSSYHIWLQFD